VKERGRKKMEKEEIKKKENKNVLKSKIR